MNEQSDIEDLPIERSFSRREVKQNDVNKDYWEWEDDDTLVRVHETPRRIQFSPTECEACPCDVRLLRDERTTKQKFKNVERNQRDNWRLRGDNNGSSNANNEFWVGRTVFKVMNADKIWVKSPHNKHKRQTVLSTGCRGMQVMSQKRVFVIHKLNGTAEE